MRSDLLAAFKAKERDKRLTLAAAYLEIEAYLETHKKKLKNENRERNFLENFKNRIEAILLAQSGWHKVLGTLEIQPGEDEHLQKQLALDKKIKKSDKDILCFNYLMIEYLKKDFADFIQTAPEDFQFKHDIQLRGLIEKSVNKVFFGIKSKILIEPTITKVKAYVLSLSEPSEPEIGTFYIKKSGNLLEYTVIDPSGKKITDNIKETELPPALVIALQKDPLALNDVNPFIFDILEITAKKGHTLPTKNIIAIQSAGELLSFQKLLMEIYYQIEEFQSDPTLKKLYRATQKKFLKEQQSSIKEFSGGIKADWAKEEESVKAVFLFLTALQTKINDIKELEDMRDDPAGLRYQSFISIQKQLELLIKSLIDMGVKAENNKFISYIPENKPNLLSELREMHGRYIRFSQNQDALFGLNSGGVCAGHVVEWFNLNKAESKKNKAMAKTKNTRDLTHPSLSAAVLETQLLPDESKIEKTYSYKNEDEFADLINNIVDYVNDHKTKVFKMAHASNNHALGIRCINDEIEFFDPNGGIFIFKNENDDDKMRCKKWITDYFVQTYKSKVKRTDIDLDGKMDIVVLGDQGNNPRPSIPKFDDEIFKFKSVKIPEATTAKVTRQLNIDLSQSPHDDPVKAPSVILMPSSLDSEEREREPTNNLHDSKKPRF